MKLRQSFTDFIFATNTDGSGKAASYVRALDMLGPILTKHYPVKIINGSMWQNFTLLEVHGIYDWICVEMKKGSASPVLADFESPNFYFIDREGQKMSLPVKFLPSQKLLEKHRELLVG